MSRTAEHGAEVGIVIIEDNRFVRAGWEAVLNNVCDFKVLAAFENCEGAFADNRMADCDIVIMDIGLPGMSGIEGIRYLRAHHSEVAIIMCTVFDDDDKVFEALCAGAVGYLLKKVQPDELVRSIREAAAGGSPMTPGIARKVVASFQRPTVRPANRAEGLTEREAEILEHLAQGMSYATIGKTLHLSLDGVRYHIRHIYEKLHVHSRSQAIARGLKDRIIRPPR